MKLAGVYLPIITPFKEDKIDLESYQKLIDYYLGKGISGIIPLATTGEAPTVSEQEFILFLEKTIEFVANRAPIFLGLSGNNTRAVTEKIRSLKNCRISGILSASPYYNLPDQRGIYEHFLRLSEATDLKIIIYNIPYRTGRNIENDTIRRLAELPNIIALKDSCGRIEQSMELLLNPPPNFSILTGHDVYYYSSLVLGGDGGILASAHLQTEKFIDIYKKIKNNDHRQALIKWKELMNFIPYLFREPNPAPIKFLLKHLGLLNSSQVRLPLVEITPGLQKQLLDALPS
jgi:4-hydroxy-tetrahydrodipicolinate synthase